MNHRHASILPPFTVSVSPHLILGAVRSGGEGGTLKAGSGSALVSPHMSRYSKKIVINSKTKKKKETRK